MNTAYSITSKYQVTIPKDIRDALKLTSNHKVAFERQGDKIVVRKVPSMEEVAAMMSADLKRRGIKPATNKQIKSARHEFYKQGMTWD